MCNKYAIVSIIFSFAATMLHAGDLDENKNSFRKKHATIFDRKSSIDYTGKRLATKSDVVDRSPRVSRSYDARKPDMDNDVMWQERRRKVLLEQEVRRKTAEVRQKAAQYAAEAQEAIQRHANQRVLRSLQNNF